MQMDFQFTADRPMLEKSLIRRKDMRKLIFFGLGALLLSTAAAQAAPRLHPEQQLAKALQGRVAGKPVDCVNLQNIRSTQIIDRTAIIYDAGNTVYVNRPRYAQSLDHWDTLVTNLHSSRLCSVDVVRLYDSSSRTWTGTVFLSDFVPYKRVR
jgi:hypothetical protein